MESTYLSAPTPALAFDFAKETQKGSGCTGVSGLGTLAPSSLPLMGDFGQLASAPSLCSCLQYVFKANERRICSMPLKIRLIVSQRSDTVKRKCPELKTIFGYVAHNLSMVLRPSPQPERIILTSLARGQNGSIAAHIVLWRRSSGAENYFYYPDPRSVQSLWQLPLPSPASAAALTAPVTSPVTSPAHPCCRGGLLLSRVAAGSCSDRCHPLETPCCYQPAHMLPSPLERDLYSQQSFVVFFITPHLILMCSGLSQLLHPPVCSSRAPPAALAAHLTCCVPRG